MARKIENSSSRKQNRGEIFKKSHDFWVQDIEKHLNILTPTFQKEILLTLLEGMPEKLKQERLENERQQVCDEFYDALANKSVAEIKRISKMVLGNKKDGK